MTTQDQTSLGPEERDEEVAELRDRLERYTRILYHTGNFLGEQYFSLGKKTIPLHTKMDNAWKTMTAADREYNNSVLGKNGEKA